MNNELQWHPISVMGAKCCLRMWRDDCEENQRSRRKAAQAQEECSGARAGRVTPVSVTGECEPGVSGVRYQVTQRTKISTVYIMIQ